MKQGLWMLKGTVKADNEEYPNEQVLVIDTEGLASTDATQKNDNRIFALALMLSSYFIYNSKGTIDEKAIEDLALITNIVKDI